ncbi:hypothetical protein BGZ61DRAFT_475556 [Ilyonectria robusta]|uniref:uncharacterized protein n=1 Tax=Ilyonectria robusta TaxID=1079257 RepID=UPI001E8DF5FA|nr:uncharacterized protein BGZ61DRAFT_475556 [Ilyonectria robusta]KAH8730000.1 hypothetical protein BGZ61DRAFT_475556 [Ilyonectria robusta]
MGQFQSASSTPTCVPGNQVPVHQSYQTPEQGNHTTAASRCAPLVAGPPAEEKVTLTEEIQAAGPVRRGTIDSGHRSRPPASEAHTTTREERGSVGEDTGRHGERHALCAVRGAALCRHCHTEVQNCTGEGGSGGKYLPTTDVAVVFISPGPSQNLG